MAKAICVLSGSTEVKGELIFTQEGDSPTKVQGEVRGLTQGDHGFHIHQFGDVSNGCASAGSHFNPQEKKHGGPTDTERHAGDLGNIVANEDGTAKVDITDAQIPLSGPNSIIGRCLVVHAGKDDLGKGGDDESLKTGNAGARVACGIIGITK
ncbi:superoxide dismutase [Cu-Zn]-like [Babylonia areolata]|uniref:superoxide dismutase [Cu-Zn]-like n=1 Tax=Babylonia areolata TaxID=304850 RepID=UPI003FD45C6A